MPDSSKKYFFAIGVSVKCDDAGKPVDGKTVQGIIQADEPSQAQEIWDNVISEQLTGEDMHNFMFEIPKPKNGIQEPSEGGFFNRMKDRAV